MDYKYEYGRYKKKVERLEEEVKKLKEDNAGCLELVKASNAIVAGLLYAVKADEEHPVRLERTVISEAVSRKYKVVTQMKEEDQEAYLVHYQEMREEAGDGGDRSEAAETAGEKATAAQQTGDL